MKIAKNLIVGAAILTAAAIISRFTFSHVPVVHVAVRSMIVFAGLLLLFAISLEGLK